MSIFSAFLFPLQQVLTPMVTAVEKLPSRFLKFVHTVRGIGNTRDNVASANNSDRQISGVAKLVETSGEGANHVTNLNVRCRKRVCIQTDNELLNTVLGKQINTGRDRLKTALEKMLTVEDEFKLLLDAAKKYRHTEQQDVSLSINVFRRADEKLLPRYNEKDFSGKRYGDWRVDTKSNSVFWVCKHLSQNARNNIGHKLHISVLSQQVSQAYDAIKGLLFSIDSPIDTWKITNIENQRFLDDPSRRGGRTYVGAQITLYLQSDGDRQYSIERLDAFKRFIQILEVTLAQANINPGTRPESDIAAEDWNYISYRHESSARYVAEENKYEAHQALKARPVFRFISGQMTLNELQVMAMNESLIAQ